jgi:hypothetical protein
VSAITDTKPDLPVRLPRSHATPVLLAVLGVLVWLIAIAIDQVHYRVSGGFDWTAARQLQACNQAIPLTGGFPATPGCAHARELVSLSHLLPVAGLALILTAAVLAVRARRAAA